MPADTYHKSGTKWRDGNTMSCYLLHVMEQPDESAYDDPELKDLVGSFPRIFCAAASTPRPLSASESVRCLERSVPCGGRPGAGMSPAEDMHREPLTAGRKRA